MKLLVDNVHTIIEGTYPRHIVDPVTSYFVEGAWFAPSFKKGHWDGRYRFVKFNRSTKQYSFPTGLLGRVTEALDKANYPYTLFDDRTYDPPEPQFHLADEKGNLTICLDQGKWNYQAEVVCNCLARGRGVIQVATGGGKTEIGASLLKSLDRPAVWITHRTGLMHQTWERLSTRLQRPIGRIGDGICDIQDITIVMVQTASHMHASGYEHIKEYLNSVDVMIGDEVHHIESDQWFDVIQEIPATWRFGLTATPDFTGPGLSLVGLCGDVIAQVSVLDLVERSVLVIPRIWFAEREYETFPAKTHHATVYKEGIVNSPTRHTLCAAVAEVFKQEEKPAITLVKRVQHGEILSDFYSYKGIKTEFIQGSVEKETREEMLRQLQSGRIHHIVAMVEIMGEGVDLPWLRACINATGAKCGSDGIGRLLIQILGRILRSSEGKYYADYVDIIDRGHKTLIAATKGRVSILEEEGYGPFIKYWRDYRFDL